MTIAPSHPPLKLPWPLTYNLSAVNAVSDHCPIPHWSDLDLWLQSISSICSKWPLPHPPLKWPWPLRYNPLSLRWEHCLNCTIHLYYLFQNPSIYDKVIDWTQRVDGRKDGQKWQKVPQFGGYKKGILCSFFLLNSNIIRIIGNWMYLRVKLLKIILIMA